MVYVFLFWIRLISRSYYVIRHCMNITSSSLSRQRKIKHSLKITERCFIIKSRIFHHLCCVLSTSLQPITVRICSCGTSWAWRTASIETVTLQNVDCRRSRRFTFYYNRPTYQYIFLLVFNCYNIFLCYVFVILICFFCGIDFFHII